MRLTRVLTVCCACIVLTGVLCLPAQARDVTAPWWRGEPRTTYQAWSPLSLELYDAATIDSNEYGRPWLYPNPSSANWYYTNSVPGPDDCQPVVAWYTPIADSLILELPNAPESVEEKWFWVQITCSQMPNTNYGFSVMSGTNYWSPEKTYEYVTNWTCSNWVTYVSEWRIPFNPSQEVMWLDFWCGTAVEQVVAETWCTPEPAMILGVLCGVCGVAAWRRRHRDA